MINTAVRTRNATVTTGNVCVTGQQLHGERVLVHESSWNNQVTNQTENSNLGPGVRQAREQQANQPSSQANSTSTCPYCGGPVPRQNLGQTAGEILGQILCQIPSEL